jgi:hypothetical protein
MTRGRFGRATSDDIVTRGVCGALGFEGWLDVRQDRSPHVLTPRRSRDTIDHSDGRRNSSLLNDLCSSVSSPEEICVLPKANFWRNSPTR